MAKRRYALGRGEPARLELEWQRGSDICVAFDGVVLTSLRAAELDVGVAVPLPDGSTIFLRRMPRSWWSLEWREPIRAERLGTPLPGSDWDPRTVGMRDAVPIAGLGVLIGSFIALWQSFQQSVGGNSGGSIAGMVVAVAIMLFFIMLAVLAALGMRFAVAVLAVPVFAAFANRIVAVVLAAPSTRVSSVAGLIFSALCIAQLVRAWTRMGGKVVPSSSASDRNQKSGSRRDRARA